MRIQRPVDMLMEKEKLNEKQKDLIRQLSAELGTPTPHDDDSEGKHGFFGKKKK